MRLKDMTVTALFSALICVAAPWTVPVGPIPITLATFVIYLSAAVLGAKKGALAVLVYVLLGTVGLPVFTNFEGGLHKLIGATGGYIAGYIPLAVIAGLAADRFEKLWSYVAGMVLGTVALYSLGTAWFMFMTKASLSYSLAVCAVPFLPGDAIKIACASVLATRLRPLLKRTTNAVSV